MRVARYVHLFFLRVLFCRCPLREFMCPLRVFCCCLNQNVLTFREVCHVSGELNVATLRLQPHLPIGFDGPSYDKSGWCFVEARVWDDVKHFVTNECVAFF